MLTVVETQETAFHIGSQHAEAGLPADEKCKEIQDLIAQSTLPKKQIILTYNEGYRLGVTELY